MQRSLETAVDGSARVRSVSAETGAGVVVWVWYRISGDTVQVSVHFDLSRPWNTSAGYGLDPAARGEHRVFPVEDLNAYEVQVQLAEELTYLSFLVLAEAEMARGDLDGALWWASKAIDESFAVDLVDPREQPSW